MYKLEELLYIGTFALRDRLDEQASKAASTCWLFLPEETRGRVCIVAHIDTVWDGDKKDRRTPTIYHDRKAGVYWSPDGLGADDRAGVYAALRLYHTTPEPYKPIVILTDLEERGGAGAEEASHIFAEELSGCTYLLELDRRGRAEAVFYNKEPKDFEDYILDFGFKKAKGSFSDVAIIGPAAGRCAVNLSIGYEDEHQSTEVLYTRWLHSTIKRVRRMLKDNHKRQKTWEHETDYKDLLFFPGGYDKVYECPRCGEEQLEDELDFNHNYCVVCGCFIDRDDCTVYFEA